MKLSKIEQLVLEQAKNEGLKQGLEKGSQERERNIIKTMLSKGLSVEQIAEITDLPIAVIAEVKKNKQQA